jgi:hypothetical protein
MADLWMLEVVRRTEKVWRGKVEVAFAKANGEQPNDARLMGEDSERPFFLDITAKISFSPALAFA